MFTLNSDKIQFLCFLTPAMHTVVNNFFHVFSNYLIQYVLLTKQNFNLHFDIRNNSIENLYKNKKV